MRPGAALLSRGPSLGVGDERVAAGGRHDGRSAIPAGESRTSRHRQARFAVGAVRNPPELSPVARHCSHAPWVRDHRGGNMGILVWLIVGGVVGWLASIIMRTNAQQGILLISIGGIVGAFLAGLIISPLIGV